MAGRWCQPGLGKARMEARLAFGTRTIAPRPDFAPRCPVSPDPHRPPRLTGSRFAFQIKLRQLTRRSPRLTVFVDGCCWHGCPLHATSPKTNGAYWREKIAANRTRAGTAAPSWSFLVSVVGILLRRGRSRVAASASKPTNVHSLTLAARRERRSPFRASGIRRCLRVTEMPRWRGGNLRSPSSRSSLSCAPTVTPVMPRLKRRRSVLERLQSDYISLRTRTTGCVPFGRKISATTGDRFPRSAAHNRPCNSSNVRRA